MLEEELDREREEMMGKFPRGDRSQTDFEAPRRDDADATLVAEEKGDSN